MYGQRVFSESGRVVGRYSAGARVRRSVEARVARLYLYARRSGAFPVFVPVVLEV